MKAAASPNSLASSMQLEVEFETLALLEGFWAAIPPAEHKAWSQRARVRQIALWHCFWAFEAV